MDVGDPWYNATMMSSVVAVVAVAVVADFGGDDAVAGVDAGCQGRDLAQL